MAVGELIRPASLCQSDLTELLQKSQAGNGQRLWKPDEHAFVSFKIGNRSAVAVARDRCGKIDIGWLDSAGSGNHY